jgi:tRNA-dihydrouridine synthase
VEWKGEKVGIFEMRRHYANYFKGLPNFKEYRMKLVGSESPDEIREIMVNIASEYSGLELN